MTTEEVCDLLKSYCLHITEKRHRCDDDYDVESTEISEYYVLLNWEKLTDQFEFKDGDFIGVRFEQNQYGSPFCTVTFIGCTKLYYSRCTERYDTETSYDVTFVKIDELDGNIRKKDFNNLYFDVTLANLQ